MPDAPHGDTDSQPEIADAPLDPAAESFFSGAFMRISRLMIGFAMVAVAASWLRWGMAIALGLVVGCAVGFLNFVWLKRIVAGMAERVGRAQAAGRRASNSGLVARYLLRYAIVAAAAYVIFKSSPRSVYGFLGGLFLPVPAIFCEAAYELAMSYKRGI